MATLFFKLDFGLDFENHKCLFLFISLTEYYLKNNLLAYGYLKQSYCKQFAIILYKIWTIREN